MVLKNNNKIEKKLDELKNEVNRSIGVAVEYFEKHVSAVAEMHLDLKRKLDDIELRMDNFEERLNSFELKLNSFEERLNRIEERLNKLEERMNRVETTLQEHTKILQEHSKILKEHSSLLMEINYDLKTKASYSEIKKLAQRVAILEKKVRQLSKQK